MLESCFLGNNNETSSIFWIASC